MNYIEEGTHTFHILMVGRFIKLLGLEVMRHENERIYNNKDTNSYKFYIKVGHYTFSKKKTI
jgi:hypothetical protein